MNIQVEPQMQQSSRKTARTFIHVSIRESAPKGKRQRAEDDSRQMKQGDAPGL
jgi:hypothetical protein